VVVLDPAAGQRGGRARQARAAQVAARRARLDDPVARLDDHVAAHGVVESAVARQVMGVPAEARPAVAVPLGRHLAAADAVADWTAAAVAAVTADLEAHPTREGSAVAVAVAAATAAGCPPDLAGDWVAHAVATGALERRAELLRPPGHRPRRTAAQERARQGLLAELDAA